MKVCGQTKYRTPNLWLLSQIQHMAQIWRRFLNVQNRQDIQKYLLKLLPQQSWNVENFLSIRPSPICLFWNEKKEFRLTYSLVECIKCANPPCFHNTQPQWLSFSNFVIPLIKQERQQCKTVNCLIHLRKENSSLPNDSYTNMTFIKREPHAIRYSVRH